MLKNSKENNIVTIDASWRQHGHGQRV